jgi:tripartite motif-containing protein 71
VELITKISTHVPPRSFKVGETGSGDGQFYSPAGIACAKWGLVVCDNGNERIHLYDGDYRFKLAFGRTGRGGGEFRRLSGVAASDDGVIAVADSGNKRVQLFDKTGKFVRSIGENGSVTSNIPCCVAQTGILHLRFP